MGITDLLCRALQSKSIDILNAMDLVATTKELLQSLRDDGFDVLLHYVISVCEKNGITVSDMSARYMDEFRSVRQSDDISVEHHYHYDVFNSAIDFQLEELQYRFNDHAVELLRLSSSLEPKNILVCLTRSRFVHLQVPFILLILVNKICTIFNSNLIITRLMWLNMLNFRVCLLFLSYVYN